MAAKVRDVMTPGPITIDPEAPLATAVAVMREKGIRHLPVIDETGGLVGIVTDRDLRCAAFGPALVEHLSLRAQRRLRGLSQQLEDLRVADVMTRCVVTAHPEEPVAGAAFLMVEGRFGCLPVIEDGKLIGLVTERDLLRTLAYRPAEPGLSSDAFLW